MQMFGRQELVTKISSIVMGYGPIEPPRTLYTAWTGSIVETSVSRLTGVCAVRVSTSSWLMMTLPWLKKICQNWPCRCRRDRSRDLKWTRNSAAGLKDEVSASTSPDSHHSGAYTGPPIRFPPMLRRTRLPAPSHPTTYLLLITCDSPAASVSWLSTPLLVSTRESNFIPKTDVIKGSAWIRGLSQASKIACEHR
jgi:hypothetical protein